MKKKIKLLLMVLICLALAACAAACSDNAPADASDGAQDGAVDEQPATRVVVDTTGAEIELPVRIDRVAIISTFPLASVYCMVVEGGERLVAMTASSLSTAQNSLLIEIAPGLNDVATDFADGDTVNVEEVFSLDPDVVFYNANDQAGTEAAAQLTELGVPCVGFNPTVQGGDVIATFDAWVTLIGEIMGSSERAQEIVDYGHDIQDMVAGHVATLAEADKKSAVIIGNYTPKAIMAAGTTFGQYWLKTIGADNVALELEKPLNPVTLEQIYAWDPQVIFLNSFSAFSAADILNSTAVEGQDWSGLTAVENGAVYKVPLGMYYWFAPCSDSPLALVWFAKTMYPDLFADIELDDMVGEYYHNFYGVDLTADQLAAIYNPPAESAMK